MKVLVLGSGAREHAIVAGLTRDPHVTALTAAPGNPGIALMCETRPVEATEPAAVLALARELDADLVVIGPEAPLVAGVADALREASIAVFGPSRAAAELEGSKAFAKEIMAAAGVPTAEAVAATTGAQAAEALDRFGAPYVVKADGLAAGKGVVVTSDRAAALAHAESCLSVADRVVIEDYLDGPEVSLFVLCDGAQAVPLEPAQDFKRIGDGDTGPNTGGMGAYSPLPWAPAGLVEEIVTTVAQPVVDEMARRGTPFSGLLYCGLALTARGLRVVEFNVRFGDPETQAVLARLSTPLSDALMAAATGQLAELPALEWSSDAAVTVVMAAGGYPDAPQTGAVISGLTEAQAMEGITVLHAGTTTSDTATNAQATDTSGTGSETGSALLTAGGRVLSVVATAPSLAAARERAYAAVAAIGWEGEQHRSDIAAAAAAGTITIPSAPTI